MNERIARMKERALNSPIYLGVGKMRIAAQSLKETRNRTNWVQRAHLNADYLNKLPIFIPEDDRIAGVGATHFNGAELEFEMGRWSDKEVKGLLEGYPDMYAMTPEDYAEFMEMYPTFEEVMANNRNSDYQASLEWDNPRMRPFLKCGVQLPAWTTRESGATNAIAQTGMSAGPGFIVKCVDYFYLLEHGARAIIERARKCIEEQEFTDPDDLEKFEYWQGIIEVYEAWINYAHRHADLAEQMAAECDDPQRKAELEEMARICRVVPENPATSFREAVQTFWFAFLMQESNCMPGGRIDQFLYPYYKHDIENGIITNDEVFELIEMIRVKCMTIHTVRGSLARGRHSGDSRWLNFAIGGCDGQGNDQSNELTLMFLKAATDMKVPHHTLTLRVNENTPIEVLKAGVDCIKAGTGMPAFVSDKSYINFYKSHGFSADDASKYAFCGCLDPTIPGMTRTHGAKFFVQPMVLDIMLHNGFCNFSGEQAGIKTGDPRDFKTFDELLAAYDAQQDHFMKLHNMRDNMDMLIATRLLQDSFVSATMVDGVECGQELQHRKFKPFDLANTFITVGGINVANSLTAIRKLVFDDKKYTMAQLMDALDADWEGYEEMRKDFINAPKYGNNNPYADEIAAYVYAKFDEQTEACPCQYDHAVPSGISISAHQPAGKSVGATPDGRKAHTILSDGMISPEQGTDVNGPLAAFQSGMKIKQDCYQATLFNMKFDPSALKSDEDATKLASVIKTYLTHDGKQIQFTVVNQDDLRDAQVNPSQHRELIVRVAGYSAYFTTLTTMMQDEIIDRTSNKAVR